MSSSVMLTPACLPGHKCQIKMQLSHFSFSLSCYSPISLDDFLGPVAASYQVPTGSLRTQAFYTVNV